MDRTRELKVNLQLTQPVWINLSQIPTPGSLVTMKFVSFLASWQNPQREPLLLVVQKIGQLERCAALAATIADDDGSEYQLFKGYRAGCWRSLPNDR
jgi:hypothetical protein